MASQARDEVRTDEETARNRSKENEISVLSSSPYRRSKLFIITMIVSGVVFLIVAITTPLVMVIGGSRGIAEASQEEKLSRQCNTTTATIKTISKIGTSEETAEVYSWSEWGLWMPPNATCGYKMRVRKCRSLYTKHHGTSCSGPTLQKENLSFCRDCKDWYHLGGWKINNVYTIRPDSQQPFQVYCDMTADGGGWTVFQRRRDGSENFFRTWDEYKSGFGNLSNEFWLGNDKIHRLTAALQTSLRVDLEDWSHNKKYAKYSKFNVHSSRRNFRLNVEGFSGSAGDSLIRAHNRMAFSTKDKDNDVLPTDNCAVSMRGAWWYRDCHDSNLNGLYVRDNDKTSITWYQFNGSFLALKFSEMKLRAT